MLSNSDRTKNPSTSSNGWLQPDEFIQSLPTESLSEGQLAFGAAHKIGAMVACRRSPDLARLLLTGIDKPTGALDGTAELLGLSRDRQNRCQYANDLKWLARPPQASPHYIPPSGGPHAYATHTHRGRSRPRNVPHRDRRAC